LWFWNFDADDSCETFDDIFIAEIEIFFLQDIVLTSVFVDRSSQCRLESDEVCTSFWSDDIIYECESFLAVIIFLVLKTDFYIDGILSFLDIENITDWLEAIDKVRNI
jgi:hypothetical protein